MLFQMIHNGLPLEPLMVILLSILLDGKIMYPPIVLDEEKKLRTSLSGNLEIIFFIILVLLYV